MSYKTVLWNSLMMMIKSRLGPRRAITPPATPPAEKNSESSMMPMMARVPFPAELITVEKLDEILGYLKGESGTPQRRVIALEHRLDDVSHELKEVKSMLTQLVAQNSNRDQPPKQASR